MKRLLVPVLDFALRAARRLRFFPFSLAFLWVGLWLRKIELRRGRAHHLRLAVAPDTGPEHQPSDPAAAITAMGPDTTDLVLDFGSRYGAGDGNTVAPDRLFSIALANPAVRSVGFYWHPASLAEDLPLWGAERPASAQGTGGVPRPYAGALREGELLLTRLAGGLPVHVLDDVAITPAEMLAVAMQAPDVMFVDLSGVLRLAPGGRPGNLLPLRAAGLSLHQKLALVGCADLYVGTDPVLAGAAAVHLPPPDWRSRLPPSPAAGSVIH